MKKKYIILLISLLSALFFISCEKDPKPDATFEYYVLGKESIKNPAEIYVGERVVFETKDQTAGDEVVVWPGDPTHNYERSNEKSGINTALREDYKTGIRMKKDDYNKNYNVAYTYPVPSGSEGFDVHVFATIVGDYGDEIFEDEKTVNIRVKDTASLVKSCKVTYMTSINGKDFKPIEVNASIKDDSIYVKIPLGVDVTNLATIIDGVNTSMFVNDQVVLQAPDTNYYDYRSIIPLTVKPYEEGNVKTYQIKRVYGSTTEAIKLRNLTSLKSKGYPIDLDFDSKIISLVVPEGITGSTDCTAKGLRGLVVYKDNEVIKEFWKVTFTFTINDLTASNEFLTVCSQDSVSTDFVIDITEDISSLTNFSFLFNNGNGLDEVDKIPTFDGDKTYSVNLDPAYFVTADSILLVPDFDLDQFSEASLEDGSAVKPGQTSIDFGKGPVTIYYTNDYVTDSIIVNVAPL